MYKKKGYLIPESGKAAKGTNIVNILQVRPARQVQAMLHFRETGDDQLYLFMTTQRHHREAAGGIGSEESAQQRHRALTLDEGDELINVQETHGSDRILIATHDGQAVCFDETDVAGYGPHGRRQSIRLPGRATMVGAAKAVPGKTVLSITEAGLRQAHSGGRNTALPPGRPGHPQLYGHGKPGPS